MRQEMVVIGNEWNFGCCAERREFSIVRIFNEDKVVGIDTAGKLSLWPKEISEHIPTEGRNSAQNKLGLAPGRFVPDQLKTSLPDSRKDMLRCASRVEARGYEDIRVDDNPFHSDFIHRKLAKVSRKILTEPEPVHLGPQSAWGRSGTGQNAGPRTATRVGFTPTDLPGIASPVYVRCGVTVRLDGRATHKKRYGVTLLPRPSTAILPSKRPPNLYWPGAVVITGATAAPALSQRPRSPRWPRG